MKFEEKQIKKADEANKITILSFFIPVQTLIVLLVSCVHIKTTLSKQLVYKQPAVRMLIVKQLLGPKHFVLGKNVKL